jgi:hypothetical protein
MKQQHNLTFVSVLVATFATLLLVVAVAHGDAVNHIPTPFGMMPETW